MNAEVKIKAQEEEEEFVPYDFTYNSAWPESLTLYNQLLLFDFKLSSQTSNIDRTFLYARK